MIRFPANAAFVKICLLDKDSPALSKTVEVLASAGCDVRPFTHPDSFLEYVRMHRPQAAVVALPAPRANGLDLAARVRESCPMTSVIFALKAHRRDQAPELALGPELLNLIAPSFPTSNNEVDLERGLR